MLDECADQRQLDCLASVVGDVHDTRHRVAPFERQRQLAVTGSVKLDAHAFQQDALKRRWAFFGEDGDRLGIAVARAGTQDVFLQVGRRIVCSLVDYSTLRPESVGILWLDRSGRHDHPDAAIRQLQRSRRAGNAAAEDEDFGFEVFGHTTQSQSFARQLYMPAPGSPPARRSRTA